MVFDIADECSDCMYMLEEGVSIDDIYIGDLIYDLEVASRSGLTWIVQKLLDYGLNSSHINDSRSLLNSINHSIYNSGHYSSTFKLLLQNGADPNIKVDYYGDIISFVLEKSCVEFVTGEIRRRLHENILRPLLEAGAEITQERYSNLDKEEKAVFNQVQETLIAQHIIWERIMRPQGPGLSRYMKRQLLRHPKYYK